MRLPSFPIVKTWRRALRVRWAALMTWIMDHIVWRVLNEDAWKTTRTIYERAWRGSRGVHKCQGNLRWVQRTLTATPWADLPKVDAPYWPGEVPKVTIFCHGLSLFSELQPLFDLLEAEGITMEHSHDAEDSGLRIFTGRYDARGRGSGHGKIILTITGSLAFDAECKAIDTGEVKKVLKFVCPGDPEYPAPEYMAVN